MIFKILYHHLVVRDDIPKLSSVWKNKIRRSIETKLPENPDLYGKPLRRSLKNYRKLRVGDYRIVFRIESNTVKIFVIKHRCEVYSAVEKRISN